MSSAVITDPDELTVLAAVSSWAQPFLRLPDVPPFGSAEWVELAPADERRAAAVVVAAWGYWCAERGYGPPSALVDRLVVEELKTAALDVWSGADWSRLAADHVPASVLAVRRTLPKTRPHDYMGGALPVWGPVDEDVEQGRATA